MRKSDLNVTVEIKSGLQKELRAWAQTATLRLGEKGFRDSEGFWRAEEEPGILEYFARQRDAAKHLQPRRPTEILVPSAVPRA